MGLPSMFFGIGLLANTCAQDMYDSDRYTHSLQPSSLQFSCTDDLSLRVEKAVGHGSFTLISNNRLGFVSVGDEVSLSYYWPQGYGIEASLRITDEGFAATIYRINKRGREANYTFLSSDGERTNNNLTRIGQLVDEVYKETMNDYFFRKDSSRQAYEVIEDVLDKARPYVRGRPLLFALPSAFRHEDMLEEITKE